MAAGQHGEIVGDELCPDCEEYPVVYNGNYFCDGWGNWCNWGLTALEPGEEYSPYAQRLIDTLVAQREES